ncbi:MAG: hypothetical protein QG657_5715 [Acidobacteriota bacterium]|nr:hypothetical protein [Acidobacteriota bacterium]
MFIGGSMIKQRSEHVPESMQSIYSEIVTLIDGFCKQYLNEEYAGLCRQLAAALARKRPSPLLRGNPDIWACGVTYAIGAVNFLFDKTQTPYIRADDLCAAFGVNQRSGANKAKLIRDMFNMAQLDPNWCLPSRIDDNPLVWLLQVNKMIVDIRLMPLEIQEEAFQKGLIPYIPAKRHK